MLQLQEVKNIVVSSCVDIETLVPLDGTFHIRKTKSLTDITCFAKKAVSSYALGAIFIPGQKHFLSLRKSKVLSLLLSVNLDLTLEACYVTLPLLSIPKKGSSVAIG